MLGIHQCNLGKHAFVAEEGQTECYILNEHINTDDLNISFVLLWSI